MLRRKINGPYAEHPVDFNLEGLIAGEKLLGRPLTAADAILDVGSNSGQMIAEAAITAETDATIICAEPDLEAAESYLRLPDEYRSRTYFVQAKGEA